MSEQWWRVRYCLIDDDGRELGDGKVEVRAASPGEAYQTARDGVDMYARMLGLPDCTVYMSARPTGVLGALQALWRRLTYRQGAPCG